MASLGNLIQISVKKEHSLGELRWVGGTRLWVGWVLADLEAGSMVLGHLLSSGFPHVAANMAAPGVIISGSPNISWLWA